MRIEEKAEGRRRKAEDPQKAPHFILHPSSFILRPDATRHWSLISHPAASAIALAIALAGCGTTAKRETTVTREPSAVPGTVAPAPGRGGYYLDDGPGDSPPPDLDAIADAVPRVEPLNRGASRPYIVMGRSYTPMTALGYYKVRGIASWYGRRYHGKQTSSGERYDMYGMSAAHPTLPIPSYVRVTNLANGKSVVVRVNDRGPFLSDRLIDLSYTAAYKLGVLNGGSAFVEVESLVPGRTSPPPALVSAPATPSPAVASAATTNAPALVAAPASAAVAATTADAPSSVSASKMPPGVFLQLGAFGTRENAESYLARLKSQVDWLADRLQVFMRDGYYRVHAGPYASQAEARDIAERVSTVLGMRPLLVK